MAADADSWYNDPMPLMNPFEALGTDIIVQKLMIAAFLGALIGIERGESNTPAGLRTNMIIAMSTCLFTMIFTTVYRPEHGEHTLLAHIVSGVGFLGAGTIFHRSDQTKGLTTAATIWMVAGVGMAAGLGMYFLAFTGTGLALATLYLLGPISAWLNEHGRERAACRCAPGALKKARRA
jgi:putative Mg2+ transporter-C (MgtC) family protein